LGVVWTGLDDKSYNVLDDGCYDVPVRKKNLPQNND
jgi:hypothetical protein